VISQLAFFIARTAAKYSSNGTGNGTGRDFSLTATTFCVHREIQIPTERQEPLTRKLLLASPIGEPLREPGAEAAATTRRAGLYSTRPRRERRRTACCL
jgi:hypothetical protein